VFDTQLFSSGIDIYIATICSIIVTGVFLRMSFAYTKKRAKRKFSQGKQPAPSITSFRNLSKILFLTSMLLSLASYWLSSALPLQINPTPLLQLFGACIVLYGCIRLEHAFSNLGNNYSPLFEAYLPFELITQGAYSVIRHPIYLYNLFVSFGLAISSGSGLVAMNAIIGLIFILKTIHLEEGYLAENFPDYYNYKKQTWRLIPHVY